MLNNATGPYKERIMPALEPFKCDQCDISLPSGWGGKMYVEDEQGKRIICGHPGEYETVKRVLGNDASTELIQSRIGFISYCICLDCLHQFKADLGDGWREQGYWLYMYLGVCEKTRGGERKSKDERQCPACQSGNVKTILELVDRSCPKCRIGTIRRGTDEDCVWC